MTCELDRPGHPVEFVGGPLDGDVMLLTPCRSVEFSVVGKGGRIVLGHYRIGPQFPDFGAPWLFNWVPA